MDNYSLADLKAVVDGDDGMFGGSSMLWIILIFLFFVAFSNGNGLFGNGNASQVERDVLETSSATQRAVMQSQYDTLLGFKDQQLQIANCCCENRLAICEQTNALATAIHAEGEATRALIQDNTITDLRERLNTANNALTTQTIVNQVVAQLQPVARPAYLTCSPYFSYFNNGSGCGCNGNI